MDEKTEFIQSDDADFDALQRMAAVVKSAAPACAPLHRIEKTGEFRMLFSELKSKEVVNLRDCRKMGHVTDFEFDECSGVIQKIIVPGIGGKTAQRLAFYMLSLPQEEAETALRLMRETEVGKNAVLIGNVTEGNGTVMRTRLGGRRTVDVLYGEGLPRIC